VTTVSRMARSAAFERFLTGVTTPVKLTRDSIDEIHNVGAIFDLYGEERVEAEDILIARLAAGDGRAATALADADSFRAISALVEATSERAAPITRVAAARALLRLDDYSGEAAMIRLLRTHEGDGFDRGAAARLLAEFPDPDREILFEVASTDPDPTARSGATDALLTLVGLDDDEVLWGEVLLSVCGRLLSSLTTVQAEAMAELREIIARWEAGETAEDMGLTWRSDSKAVRRFVSSIDSGKADLRTHGLKELTGRERTLVENVVLLRLHADRRAVRAAGTLGVHRAVEPLRELLASAEGHARAEIKSVLATLTG
jgi:HEAT repeat protein